jgi:hypothetical protein
VARHRAVSPQRWVQVVPPQSTSVSLALVRPSRHRSTTQRDVEAEQMPLAQSLSTAGRHASPVAHFRAHEPPQSMSASVPFRMPSTQVSLTHTPETLQAPLVQSAEDRQRWPTAQRLVQPEALPQSRSDSAPLTTPSRHRFSVQRRSPPTGLPQKPGLQSLLAVQSCPGPQRMAFVGPPQSTSVSPWLSTMSSDRPPRQVAPVQMALRQSCPVVHAVPRGQVAPHVPPQSTPASFASFCSLVQVEGQKPARGKVAGGPCHRGSHSFL